MVELVAVALASVTHRLWSHVVGRVVAVALWLLYAAGVPHGLTWAEEVLPMAVNLALPFAGVAVATVSGVRHYRHKHHAEHEHEPEPPPPEPVEVP